MQVRLLVVLAFLTGLLNGCAHDGRKISSPNEGAVVVRLLQHEVANVQTILSRPYIVVDRKPDDPTVNRDNTFLLYPLEDGAYQTPVFSSSLPAGVYKIKGLNNIDCSGLCYEIPFIKDLGEFEIKPGQLTDLGVIAYSFMDKDDKLIVGYDAKTDSDTQVFIKEMAPGLASVLSNPVKTWMTDTVPEDMMERFRYAILDGAYFSSAKELGNGDFLYGDAHGKIVLWENGAHKYHDDQVVRVPVESVLITKAGSWLAGGLGMLKMKDSAGKTWRSVLGNLPFGTILDLQEWNGRVIVSLLRDNKVRLFMSKAEIGGWEPLEQYEVKTQHSFFDDNAWRRPVVRVMDDLVVVVISGKPIVNLDLRTMKSVAYETLGAVNEMTVSGDGVLRCMCSGKNLESRDYGRTWRNINDARDTFAKRLTRLPVFKDQKHGVAIMGGGMFSDAKVVYTEDGGATWIPSLDLKFIEGWQFYFSKKTGDFYIANRYGMNQVSRDNGKTWSKLH